MKDLIERLRTEPPVYGPSSTTQLLREEAAAELERVGALWVAETRQNERYREALEKIERWFGEFPETGKMWPATQGGGKVSHGAAYGSNGERDFMRQVARVALSTSEGEK